MSGTKSIDQSGTSSIDQSGTTSIDQSGIYSIDQSGTASIDQSGIYSIDQSGTASIDQSGIYSIDQSGTASIDQSGIYSIDQSGTASIDQSGIYSIDQSGTTSIDQSGIYSIDQSGTASIDQSGIYSIDQSGTASIDQSGIYSIDQSGGITGSLVLAGPVESIDNEAGLFSSMGQTVMASRADLSRLEVGDYVSVYGSVVSPGLIYADNADRSGDEYVPGSMPVFIAGIPSSVDRDRARMTIGNLEIDYAAALAHGEVHGSGIWAFSGIQPIERGLLVSDVAAMK
ncbi:MAG: hypothetical protein QNI99_20265 [Woeseiaceae bacterium]|nr:hypothetical protein [Woeseiaceae bacterium]